MKRTILVSIIFLVIAAGCTKQQIPDETLIAQHTLINFFDSLNTQNFHEAIKYFSQDEEIWESLRVYTLPEETNRAKIIKNYCQATVTCLPAIIVGTTKIHDDEYRYQVQFQKQDGSIFIFGPCCGATEEEMPPKDTFEYTVKKTDGTFKVTTPPIFVP